MWHIYVFLGFVFILFVICGYRLYHHKWLWLLSGYNLLSKDMKEKYKATHDINSISRYFAFYCFFSADYILVMTLGVALKNQYILIYATVIEIVVGLAFITYVNFSKRFKR